MKMAREVPNKKPPGTKPGGRSSAVSRENLSELDVGSLLAAAATIVLDLERDLVAFVKRRHAGTLESRGVYEHVLAAVFRLDKAEAARMIEELHCAIDTSHGGNSFPVRVSNNGPWTQKSPVAS
jgi:hypothetical protein